ncbi:hypothetical protein WJX74_006534 [Apatococcus lobatus]|uniref:Glutathione S-transferase n=1 Tax=Apatococcus lobatus TaxID=904363 RepID=A0AAW1QVF7_9CHLO
MTDSSPLIHHSEWCRSLRPVWLLAELGVDFDIKAYKWDDLKKPEYLEINPSGLVPVLQDGDVKMQESGAITQFLAEKYGQGQVTVEAGTPEHAAYCQWFHVSEASFMAPGVAALFHYNLSSDKDPEVKNKAIKCINDVLQILDKELKQKGSEHYLITNKPTAADIMMGYPLIMLQDVFKDEVDLSPYPKVTSYIQRLRALSSTQKTFGEYNSLPSGLHHIKAGPQS